MKLGLLVNPIAGLGGAVGLKGTDAKADEARALGAAERAHPRAVAFLRALSGEPTVFTAGGRMGDDACAEAGVSAIVVHTPAEPTNASDTREAAVALAKAGVDLIVFAGGDGTAADVAAGLDGWMRERQGEGSGEGSGAGSSLAQSAAALAGRTVPVLGIPAGVKMYSAVFADTPQAAAQVAESFDSAAIREVLDIDEDAFRRGELKIALKGALLVPTHARVQASKSAGDDDDVEAQSLGRAVAEVLEAGHTYVLGAGTTMMHVKDALGIGGTLLGLDVVWLDEEAKPHVVKRDATEADLLEIETGFELVLSPIGAQGFFLGRGNLPLSPAVLARLAIPGDVRVVATPWKLLHTPALKVDTGDPMIDARFPRYLRVLTGFAQSKMIPVVR